jgi:predicted CXXCH cytochrome family protein
MFYAPGESVSFQISFRDGAGNRLSPPGQLPTYAEFASGQVESGLRYLDLGLQTRLYHALKHRESNLLFVLSGPTDQLRTPQTVVDPTLFFGPQVPFATTAVDGFTAVAQTVPPAGIVFGGLFDPTLWALPVSDVVTFSIPADAEPGTYLAAIKARRDFAGEALNRGVALEIQVGQSQPTDFTPQTVCVSCHSQEQRSFAKILHGVDDRRACFGCHASLGIEFDNALDIRVHAIHDRSQRFDADIHDCSLCHLTPPSGPQRGVLP